MYWVGWNIGVDRNSELDNTAIKTNFLKKDWYNTRQCSGTNGDCNVHRITLHVRRLTSTDRSNLWLPPNALRVPQIVQLDRAIPHE